MTGQWHQLSFVDAGAPVTEWGQPRPRAKAPTVTISRIEYDTLVSKARRWDEQMDRNRQRSRRWHALNRPAGPGQNHRPVRARSTGRSGPQTPDRPASVASNRVQNRPDRSGSKKGALGVKPVTEWTGVRNPQAPFSRHRRHEAVEQVVQLVGEQGIPVALSRADQRAIATCMAPPPEIAEAFAAAARGEWGGSWLRENLSFKAVVNRLHGWRVSRSGLPARSDRPGPELVLVTD